MFAPIDHHNRHHQSFRHWQLLLSQVAKDAITDVSLGYAKLFRLSAFSVKCRPVHYRGGGTAIKFTFVAVGPTLEKIFFALRVIHTWNSLKLTPACRLCTILRPSLGMQNCPDFYIAPNPIIK